MKIRNLLGVCLLAALMIAPYIPAAHAETGASGLPIPRFVSIAAERANMRVGPDFRYPIEWVYQRRALPVEVIGEYDLWRQVRDIDGDEGWIHKQLLSSKRSAIVSVPLATLHKKPERGAAHILYAAQGVMGRLEQCEADWCEIEIGRTLGWIAKDQIWGVYAAEVFR